MPKYSRKFIVFVDDWTVYEYNPEVDDHLVKEGKVVLFDEGNTLKDAKKFARENLDANYQQLIEALERLTYKNVK